jgi:hypothetical protein
MSRKIINFFNSAKCFFIWKISSRAEAERYFEPLGGPWVPINRKALRWGLSPWWIGVAPKF